MDISGLSNAASLGAQISLFTLKKGMDQQQAQMTQLLQALPSAPQPAHLGQNVDFRA